jgi:hypothetical protein
MSGMQEYAGAVAVGLLLLVLRRNLSWAALTAIALDEMIEAVAIGCMVCAAHAKRTLKISGRK